jgi:eukaryotic-like serine/threonine-protein kinase
VVQTEFGQGSPVVSPDRKWLAYDSNTSGRPEVYITAFPAAGAKWQVSTEGGHVPKWRRDGKELFFLDPSDNLLAVDVSTLSNSVRLGAPHVLFQASAGAYDVTADGKKFLFDSADVKEDSQPMTLVQNWTAELKR